MKTRIARTWTEQLLSGAAPSRTPVRPSTPFLRTFFSATQRVSSPRLAQTSARRGVLLSSRFQQSGFLRHFRSFRFKSGNTPTQRLNPTPHLGSPEPALSLSQRLKQLSREYGWTAVGVYFALSVLDFPFCFLAVRLLGTDRIGHYEDAIKNAFWSVVRLAFPEAGKKTTAIPEDVAEATAREGDIGAVDAAVKNGADACKACPDKEISLATYMNCSNLDAARPRLPCAQVFYICQGSIDGSCSSQGREDSPVLGLQHWKEEAKERLNYHHSSTPTRCWLVLQPVTGC